MEETNISDSSFSGKNGTKNKDEFHHYVRILLEQIKRSINFKAPESQRDRSMNRKHGEETNNKN